MQFHPDPQALFESGLALFNAGDHFHAHDVWEDLWHIEAGSDKRFAQALVQFAVILVHHSRGNARGVRSVTTTALNHLAQASPSYRGLTRETVLAELTRVTAPTLALPESFFAPGYKHPDPLPTTPGDPARLPHTHA
jgi:uncharacterized protein